MEPDVIQQQAREIITEATGLLERVNELAASLEHAAISTAPVMGGSESFLSLFTVFVLACFVGYYVVWSVTPALHSPLMGVTNAISSVIIVGGLLAAGPAGDVGFAKIMGFLAIILASINIFGGFIVTQRMLAMFKKKAK